MTTPEIEFFVKEFLPRNMRAWEPYSDAELTLFAQAICDTNPDFIFEWGTYLGISAQIFWHIKTHFKLAGDIHTIDLPEDCWRADVLEKDKKAWFSKDNPEIGHHSGDGVDTALDLCRRLNAKNPLFFCDGDHEYVSVKRELETIYATYPNARVLVHDTFAKTIDQGNNGPFLATMETKESKNLNMISVETGPGLIFLYGAEDD